MSQQPSNKMKVASLPTEVILTKSSQSLGKIHLDWMPQPGHYLNLEGETYAVLERRHRYQLKSGRYRLDRIALYVQSAPGSPVERSFTNGRWVLGDATCRYNAGSEIIRCAVNPEGPCQQCHYYEPKDASTSS